MLEYNTKFLLSLCICYTVLIMKKYLKKVTMALVSLIVLYILFPKTYNPVHYVTDSGPMTYFVAKRDFCYGLSLKNHLCVGIVLNRIDENVKIH